MKNDAPQPVLGLYFGTGIQQPPRHVRATALSGPIQRRLSMLRARNANVPPPPTTGIARACTIATSAHARMIVPKHKHTMSEENWKT
jgi:hypothetical protein